MAEELDGIIVRRRCVTFYVKCGSGRSPECEGKETRLLGTFRDEPVPGNPHRPIKEATRILREEMDWSGTTGMWVCRPCMDHTLLERAGGKP